MSLSYVNRDNVSDRLEDPATRASEVKNVAQDVQAMLDMPGATLLIEEIMHRGGLFDRNADEGRRALALDVLHFIGYYAPQHLTSVLQGVYAPRTYLDEVNHD